MTAMQIHSRRGLTHGSLANLICAVLGLGRQWIAQNADPRFAYIAQSAPNMYMRLLVEVLDMCDSTLLRILYMYMCTHRFLLCSPRALLEVRPLGGLSSLLRGCELHLAKLVQLLLQRHHMLQPYRPKVRRKGKSMCKLKIF